MTRSPITTHVLDTARGIPAAGVAVELARANAEGEFVLLARGVTDADGRIADLLPPSPRPAPGIYRLTFGIGAYEEALGGSSFFTEVPVVFVLREPDRHHHVPLLVSPFAYSTYRGS
jgi:5-hydroxyisourate hydrolase